MSEEKQSNSAEVRGASLIRGGKKEESDEERQAVEEKVKGHVLQTSSETNMT